MVDEDDVTTTDSPAAPIAPATADTPTALPPDEPRIVEGFHYPVVRRHTGLVQFCYGAGAEVETGRLRWLQAEVKKIGREDYANALVSSGMHSHVPADTPLGQPIKYRNDRETNALRTMFTDEQIANLTPEQKTDALKQIAAAKQE